MMNKIRTWIKQKLCKHEYGWYVKTGKFVNIQGERRIKMCSKCGKLDGEYFAEYEGNGYK